ncbi:MAG: response regulator [Rhizobiales bacterium]|nr:response regulator [Hyphomicrobiales bacterium]
MSDAASPGDDGTFEQRARLALVWQDLVTPVRAIAGYQDLILEQARARGLAELLPYFEKVLVAADALGRLVGSLLDPAAAGGDDPLASAQGRLRHDLRTPLNAIIGYSEMALEDIAGRSDAGELASDIERLLGEARSLLDRLDAIVDFSRSGAAASAEDPGHLVAGLLKTLRAEPEAGRAGEVGHILVVDDNESNRDLLERRLVHEGHTVVTVDSGRKALDLLRMEDFDLVLLDLVMADMNGLETLQAMKADERLHGVPVIMISGLSETEAVMRCIEAGAEDYLPKPFNIVLLRARINASLERMRWRQREQRYLAELKVEKEKSEALLRNILPAPIVRRLNDGETTIADGFPAVSILFADLVGFTPVAARMSPERLVDRLNDIVTAFDELALRLGVEKIKTIGDAYMAVAGLPEPRDDHADAIARFAMAMMAALEENNAVDGAPAFQLRVGIHTGPVVAGIIGHHKFIYDVWGDTVNVASRLESSSTPGRIQVSEPTRDALAGRYRFESRGLVDLKGRGPTPSFFLLGPG